jgi:glycine cleavage system H protein
MSARYTKEHEWVRVEGDVATCGISAFAADQLGDVVYVELPKVGQQVEQGREMAVVESAKAASDVYAPVTGQVLAVNDALTGNPEKVNEGPEGEGWFVKIQLTKPAEVDALMDEAAYANFAKA